MTRTEAIRAADAAAVQHDAWYVVIKKDGAFVICTREEYPSRKSEGYKHHCYSQRPPHAQFNR